MVSQHLCRHGSPPLHSGEGVGCCCSPLQFCGWFVLHSRWVLGSWPGASEMPHSCTHLHLQTQLFLTP